MTTYAIMDDNGDELTDGLQESVALLTAQRMTNNRGEPVYLYVSNRGAKAGVRKIDPVKTSYEIRTGPEHHSGERPWMRLASTVTVDCKTVGARCSYYAETTRPVELEAALDADDDVTAYEVV